MPATVEVCETSRTLAPQHWGSAPPIRPGLLSKGELALTLGVSIRTIEEWMAQKRIPFLRLSSRFIKFNLERVNAALDRYEIQEVGRPKEKR
jgi:excisionase family DNA binding protein